MLKEFGPSLFVIDGPSLSFLGLPLPTRMVVARLADGSAWVWSPIPLTDEVEAAVLSIGNVRHIVTPNKVHNLYLAEWADRFPEAKIYAPLGLAKRRPNLRFDESLGDAPPEAWTNEIDQLIFKGSFALAEVIFFHRPSRTAILGDLALRVAPEDARGLKGFLMRRIGIVGNKGSTPLELRFTYLRRALARQSRDELLEWEPERFIVAHGACAESNATEILRGTLGWI